MPRPRARSGHRPAGTAPRLLGIDEQQERHVGKDASNRVHVQREDAVDAQAARDSLVREGRVEVPVQTTSAPRSSAGWITSATSSARAAAKSAASAQGEISGRRGRAPRSAPRSPPGSRARRPGRLLEVLPTWASPDRPALEGENMSEVLVRVSGVSIKLVPGGSVGAGMTSMVGAAEPRLGYERGGVVDGGADHRLTRRRSARRAGEEVVVLDDLSSGKRETCRKGSSWSRATCASRRTSSSLASSRPSVTTSRRRSTCGSRSPAGADPQINVLGTVNMSRRHSSEHEARPSARGWGDLRRVRRTGARGRRARPISPTAPRSSRPRRISPPRTA